MNTMKRNDQWLAGKIAFLPKHSINENQLLLNLVLLFVICISHIPLSAQFRESESIDYVEFGNRVFKPNIKTVQFHRDGWDMSPPLIELNSDEKLMLSFDDLDADGKEYSFTIVHCAADWKPSNLQKHEYIDGYNEDYIYEFQYSVNTIVSYTHYELLFPTVDLVPELPGNYVLKVYFEHEDSVYFTRRFMILEQKVDIEGRVKQASTISDRNYKQEVDFKILAPHYNITSPYRDLKVVVQQNGRWDNAITDLKPKMVVAETLDYNYDFENVFDGGNEFRSVDFKSLTYYTENIDKIDYDHSGYHIFVKPDERRTFKVYKSEDDINGKIKIKTEDQVDTETRSEYANVHFFLPYDAPLLDADIFINGALTDWTLNEDGKMRYDYNKSGYVISMLLKQGYYNYQYVMKYHNKTKGEAGFIEGNHWETSNEYTILVYNREHGDQFDRLVGVTHINSFVD